jgi:hypothetical protein
MSGFTFICPRARPDEAGAHDITDVMERANRDDDHDDRVLYCRRCGQAVPLGSAVAQTRQSLDSGDAR